MNSSFYNGVSGIKTHQFGMDVWANNISNISTKGFLGSTPEFSSLFSTTLSDSYFSPTTDNKGLGSQAQTTSLNLAQGILENTDRAFDLAISGEGWFGVKAQNGEIYYTRSGEYLIDKNGNLVDASGNYLMATLGGNITPTSLDQETLNSLGNYYGAVTTRPVEPFAISALGDVPLGTVGVQDKVTLPDYLYFPPEATTYVNYQANLSPKIIIENQTISISANNNIIFSPTYPTASISGTLANNTNITNLKEGDTVTLTILDDNNISVQAEAQLDSNLNFTLSNIDISKLDATTALELDTKIKVTQEIPNVEHFTTEIIAPDGNKDIIDMTFTKRVPQQSLESTWDANLQILRYFEDYKINTYNPNIIYDPTQYNVNLTTNQVTKIYDPTLYKVDLGLNKVYQIIDEQTGIATFGGGGQILSSTIPELSNSGTPLQINIGEPYLQESVAVSSSTLNGSTYTITGTAPLSAMTEEGIHAGDNVSVKVTDINGKIITSSAKIQNDGSWKLSFENFSLDPTNPTISAYVILQTGYDGIISNVDLDKARVSQKDGYIEGFLTNYGMDGNGNVIAEFSNGRSAAIAKVALYHFQNDQGLTQVSSTYFSTSANSGNPIFYTDSNGENFLGSKIMSNKLEGSNVSMATALTELIVMQKAFDANAKSITTSDELIQNAINMKT